MTVDAKVFSSLRALNVLQSSGVSRGIMNDIAIQPKTKISAAEMERRRKALRNVTANNRLEGQFSGPESNEIFEAFLHGDIELHEILPRIKALHHHL